MRMVGKIEMDLVEIIIICSLEQVLPAPLVPPFNKSLSFSPEGIE